MAKIDDLTMLMSPCQDKEHLHAWIQKYTGLDLPNQTISRYSNSNPFDFVWSCYRTIMDGKAGAFLGLAGRDSMKTLGLSIIDLLAFLHDGRNIVHIAMTTQQGSRARNYLDSFVNRHPVIRASIVKQNTREIKLTIDGREVGLEIIPATPKAVQGSHASVVTFDEISSSVEPNNLRAYRDAHGILGSHTTLSGQTKPAVIIKITSRQTGDSLAEAELEDAPNSKINVMRWTTLDATERCPDERSGVVPTPLWYSVLKGDKYTEEEFVHVGKQEGYEHTTDTFDGCRHCPIAAFCAGDLKKQESTSFLLRTIDDVINKIRLAGSWDWAVSQIMSLKPSSEGLVYFEFDRQVHQPGWSAMWQTLTGSPSLIPVTRELFINELKKRNASFYAGIDWGWSSPSTCVVVAVDAKEMIYVVEAIGKTYTPDPEFIEMLRTTIQRKYGVQMYCPDIANGSGNQLLRQANLPTTDEIDKSISLGLNIVKGLLRVPGSNGMTRIFFAPDLQSQIVGVPGIIEEFGKYRKKIDAAGNILDDEDPEKGNDHYMDALRYLSYWLFGRMRLKVGTDFERAKKPIQHTNIPTLQDIARQHGLTFVDNRETTPEEQSDDDSGPKGPIWGWTGT